MAPRLTGPCLVRPGRRAVRGGARCLRRLRAAPLGPGAGRAAGDGAPDGGTGRDSPGSPERRLGGPVRGEGQDAARAWWVRPADQAAEGTGLRVIDAGWDDWVLSDADPPGSRVITTSHDGQRLLVRSFPGDLRGRTSEETRFVGTRPSCPSCRRFDLPDDGCLWHEAACFAGDFIVAKLDGPAGCFTAIDRTA